MKTTPIKLSVVQGDTHPLVVWTLLKQDDSLLDTSGAGRKTELWYWERDHVGNVKKALWKVELAKTPGATTDQEKAEAHFTPTTTEPWYPAEFLSRGRGERVFVGWLRYYDSGSTPPTDKWVEDALEVTAEDAPVAP